MKSRRLTIRHLVEAFEKAGMPVSQSWVRRQETKGNLKLPRSTTDFKKPQGVRKSAPVRVLTQPQIDKILKAFLPGGRGYYDYEKDSSSMR